ncbi:hypothetical protein [Nocardia rhizosphaerihabitans]|uniref:hypothetical protein n=1 Tax=Nocardia rhizosphaerihabitans TaxID=1691570 RepID=UPI001667106A|nr:hypothetical protein [Nocardia rhizosphaerihabitans]
MFLAPDEVVQLSDDSSLSVPGSASDLFRLSTPASDSGPFRMPIEDVVTINRRVFIIGRVEQGAVHGGDVIEISGDGQSITARVVRVEFLCWRGDGEPSASAGDNVGLRVARVRPEQIRVGWIANAQSAVQLP